MGRCGEAKMVNSYGLRSGTRDVFSNPGIHKGMPHKYYHGKTGRVFNITPRAVGVEINKHVTPKGQIIRKRIHVRIEHVRKSRCREEFLQRVIDNDLASKEFKKTGVKKELKRMPGMPKDSKVVSLAEKPTLITPLKYDPMY